MTMNITTIQRAIDKHAAISGPVTFTVGERDGDGFSLIASYDQALMLDDDPWTKFGGDLILADIGADRYDGGMDAADQHGEVQQWAIIRP